MVASVRIGPSQRPPTIASLWCPRRIRSMTSCWFRSMKPGNLTDHYDPRTKHISLSQRIYREPNIASAAIAAHETGHAIQDKEGYGPMRLRSAMIPICLRSFIAAEISGNIFFVAAAPVSAMAAAAVKSAKSKADVSGSMARSAKLICNREVPRRETSMTRYAVSNPDGFFASMSRGNKKSRCTKREQQGLRRPSVLPLARICTQIIRDFHSGYLATSFASIASWFSFGLSLSQHQRISSQSLPRMNVGSAEIG